MKKWVVCTLALVGCTIANAVEFEKAAPITSKVDLGDKSGYFVLADGSSWKVMPFEKRWRSLSEWWSGTELNVPLDYETSSDVWYLGTEVEVFTKFGNRDVEMADASNATALSQCTHLLLNTRTGKVLFAMALEPELFLVHLFNDAEKIGHKRGYDDGYKYGYQKGYDEGFQRGHEEAGVILLEVRP